MGILSVEKGWIYCAVFLICFGGILLMRSRDRFWLPPLVTWLVLFIALITNSVMTDHILAFQHQEVTVLPPAPGIQEQLADINRHNTEVRAVMRNWLFFRLLGFHTVLTIIWLLIGYQKFGARNYRRMLGTFVFLALMYAGLELYFALR